MLATREEFRLDSYPEGYPWRFVPVGCKESDNRLGMVLVDQEGVPQFFRWRCRGQRCRVEGRVHFHITDLLDGSYDSKTYPYRIAT